MRFLEVISAPVVSVPIVINWMDRQYVCALNMNDMVSWYGFVQWEPEKTIARSVGRMDVHCGLQDEHAGLVSTARLVRQSDQEEGADG